MTNNISNFDILNKEKFEKDCSIYDYIPTVLPAVERIIVIGDVHGDYKLTLQLLKLAKVIEINNNIVKWIGGKTYVVQVGDQIDRCRRKDFSCHDINNTYKDEASDIKILKFFTKLHNQAKKHGGAVISLIGNHELMNILGQMDYVSHLGIKEFDDYKDPNNPQKKFKSGLDARKYAFSVGNEYSKFIGCTRLGAVIIGSNLFAHAGVIPEFINELSNNKTFKINIKNKKDIQKINYIIRQWLLNKINEKYVSQIISGSQTSMFWNRILGNIPTNVSMEEALCVEYLEPVLKLFNIGNMIIGHTPQFVKENPINGTCDNKLWRVDIGASDAFHYFDKYIKTGQIDENRKPQVLEILNDNEFKILKCENDICTINENELNAEIKN